MGKRILDLFRRDVVLTASLVLAALSCLVTPPGPDYLAYIDYNTLVILLCLMLMLISQQTGSSLFGWFMPLFKLP